MATHAVERPDLGDGGAGSVSAKAPTSSRRSPRIGETRSGVFSSHGVCSGSLGFVRLFFAFCFGFAIAVLAMSGQRTFFESSTTRGSGFRDLKNSNRLENVKLDYDVEASERTHQRAEDARRLWEFYRSWQRLDENQAPCGFDMATLRVYHQKSDKRGFLLSIHVVAHSLLEAIASGFVFVPSDTPSEHVSNSRCRSGNVFGCTFKPLTRCPSRKLIEMGKLVAKEQASWCLKRNASESCLYVRRDTRQAFSDRSWSQKDLISLLKKKAGIVGDYGVGFYYGETVRFVTRPNKALQRHMERILTSVFPNQYHGDGDFTFLRNVMSVEINTALNPIPYPFDVDDLAKVATMCMTTLGSGKITDVWFPVNANMVQLFQKRLDDLMRNRQISDETPRVVTTPKYFWTFGDSGAAQGFDESMTIAAQLLLFSRTSLFIGSTSSETLQFVWEIMSSQWKTDEPRIYDVHGSPYFSRWAMSPFPHEHFVPSGETGEKEVSIVTPPPVPCPKLPSLVVDVEEVQNRFPTVEARTRDKFHRGLEVSVAEGGGLIRIGAMPPDESFETCTAFKNKKRMPLDVPQMFDHYRYMPSQDLSSEIVKFRNFMLQKQGLPSNLGKRTSRDGSAGRTACELVNFFQDVKNRKYTGFGSRMSLLQNTFGHVLVAPEYSHASLNIPPPWAWADERACPFGGHECYFQPVTGCSKRASKVVKTVQEDWMHSKPWKELEAMHNVTVFRLTAEVQFFLLQPHYFMHRDIEKALELLQWDTLPKPILCLHIRHGKKLHESKYYSNEDFLQVVEKMRQEHGFQTVFFLTDDHNATRYMEERIPKLGYDAFVSLDNPVMVAHGYDKGTEKLHDAYHRIRGGVVDACHETTRTLLNIYIGALCDGFVGTYNSNLGRLILRLIYARIGRVPPNYGLDEFFHPDHRDSCYMDGTCENKWDTLIPARIGSYPFVTTLHDPPLISKLSPPFL